MGRKSTAQPRPVLNVPPRGIGPIVDPNENDVLCGRGGRINSHAGNVQFREIIHNRKKEYLAPTTKKLEKAHIAAAIVNDIRGMDPPGRFLKEDRDTGVSVIVCDFMERICCFWFVCAISHYVFFFSFRNVIVVVRYW